MILLGCEFCIFELAITFMYGLPFVGPAIFALLRWRPKHTAGESNTVLIDELRQEQRLEKWRN
jgi:hypothetical protein